MKRSHPIHQRCDDAYEKLRLSAWLIRVRYVMFVKQDEIADGLHTNVYAVYDPSDAIKIGIAGDVQNRLSGIQGGNPQPLTLIASCPGTRNLEQFFHSQLLPWRIHGEWFQATDEVLALVSMIVSSEEIAIDLASSEPSETPGCLDTLGHLTWEFEEAQAAA